MRLLVILFYGILAYILWRMVRVGIRMMQGARGDRDGHVYGPPSEPAVPSKDFPGGEILDAKFEDIPPAPKSAKEAGKNDA